MKKNLSNMIISHVLSNTVTIILMIIVIFLLISKAPSDCQQGDIFSFLQDNKELSSREDMPRITYLTQEFINQGKELNTELFADAQPGNVLLEYPDLNLVMDQETGKTIGRYEVKTLPEDFLQKLSAHEELANFQGQQPQIMLIDNSNIETFKQQIEITDDNIGDYLVSLQGGIFVYDYESDEIKLSLLADQQPQIPWGQNVPADFSQKLFAHPEMQGLENTAPSGGQVLQETLAYLSQSDPGIVPYLKIGDYLLTYPDRVIVYDYQADNITGVFALQ